MAITDFNQQLEDRRIALSEEGEIVVREKWIAQLDAPETNPATIFNDPKVPLQFSPHPKSPLLTLAEIRAEGSNKSRTVWYFRLVWKTSSGRLNDPNATQFSPDKYDANNPGLQRVRWSFGTEKRVLDRGRLHLGAANYYGASIYDNNGGQLHVPQNSAGQAFSPTLQYDYRFPIALVERNELKAPQALFDYIQGINQDAFQIDGLVADPYTARMLDIGVSDWKRFEQYDYRTITYKIGFKPLDIVRIKGPADAANPAQTYFNTHTCSAWDAVAVDQGLYERNRVDIRFKRDENGNPSKDPDYLDGNGKFLDLEDIIGTDPTSQEIAEWVRYRRYMYLTPLPFSALGFY